MHRGEKIRVVCVIGPLKSVSGKSKACFVKKRARVSCIEIACILEILLYSRIDRAVGICISYHTALTEDRLDISLGAVNILCVGFV